MGKKKKKKKGKRFASLRVRYKEKVWGIFRSLIHFGRVWYKEKILGVFWGGVCVPGYTQGPTGGGTYHDTRLRSGPEFLTVNPSLPSHTQISSYKNPY